LPISGNKDYSIEDLFFPDVGIKQRIISKFLYSSSIKTRMKSSLFLLGLVSITAFSEPAKAYEFPANTNPLSNNSVIQPTTFELPDIKHQEPIPQQDINNKKPASNIPVGHEMSRLSAQVQTLMARYKFLKPGMFFLDLQTGDYLDVNGDMAFPAASTIKYPILIALFQEVDAGRVRLDETLVMRRQQMVGGSGNMQYRRAGTKFNLLEVATRMMTISDNTATNMIIDRLGGKQVLNQRFQTWGLQKTVMRNMLGDFNGTNTTSARDLVKISTLIENQQLLSDSSHSRVIDIMRRCQNRRLLPSGLGSGANIAHKTGTLRFILGDAGIIQTSSGKRYLAGILVRRPHHDTRARTFIQQVSRMVYNYLDQSQVTTSRP
jgi:beta-lactamase class A